MLLLALLHPIANLSWWRWSVHPSTVIGIAALGAREGLKVTQSQVAATIANLLGEDYNGAQPKAAKPLPLN